MTQRTATDNFGGTDKALVVALHSHFQTARYIDLGLVVLTTVIQRIHRRQSDGQQWFLTVVSALLKIMEMLN